MLTSDLDQNCTDPAEKRCSIFNNGTMVSILPVHVFELSSGVQIGKHVSVFTDGLYLRLYFERQQLMSLSYKLSLSAESQYTNPITSLKVQNKLH